MGLKIGQRLGVASLDSRFIGSYKKSVMEKKL